MKRLLKQLARRILPLTARQALVVWLGRQKWISEDHRYWWSQELILDMHAVDPNTYHKFLWQHHLAYARYYDIEGRFGEENIDQSRKLLFCDAKTVLRKIGIDPGRDICSVFEVGCSLGYLLRYLETEVFTGAEILEGIDIDRYAIAGGKDYLRRQGSKVKLFCMDMEGLQDHFDGRRYDIVICAGVLMYLKETEARRVVKTILTHTNTLLVMSGLAHPEHDNGDLHQSDLRERDGTFIHNFDAMVGDAGGAVIYRRYEGDRRVDGHTIYFVLARPGTFNQG